MKYSEMIQAVSEARETEKNLNHFVLSMAEMLVGKLRAIKPLNEYTKEHRTLMALKKELENYNGRNATWKP